MDSVLPLATATMPPPGSNAMSSTGSAKRSVITGLGAAASHSRTVWSYEPESSSRWPPGLEASPETRTQRTWLKARNTLCRG